MDVAVYVLGGIVVLILVWGIAIFNGLVRGRHQIDNGWRQIGVQLKRRHDLIPNLVEMVKDSMSYEQETLRQVIEARNAAAAASAPDASIPAEAALSASMRQLFALMENYPDLKADSNVARLMEELASTENKIAFARQFYNDSVMGNNNRVDSFPSNLVAGSFGFGHATYFEVSEAETAVPKVDLR